MQKRVLYGEDGGGGTAGPGGLNRSHIGFCVFFRDFLICRGGKVLNVVAHHAKMWLVEQSHEWSCTRLNTLYTIEIR